MPSQPPSSCRIGSCPHLVPAGGQCPAHPRKPWEGSTRRKRLPKGWKKLRESVLNRDGHICYLCGDTASEVDHIARGDNHSMENLAAICTPCHRRKSSREGSAARNPNPKF